MFNLRLYDESGCIAYWVGSDTSESYVAWDNGVYLPKKFATLEEAHEARRNLQALRNDDCVIVVHAIN